VQAVAGRPEETAASYRKVLVLSPGDAAALNALAGVC
jgi:hypothetical protein